MTRGGYSSEHRAKMELIEIFGSENVIKVAIGGAMDFIVLSCGELLKAIEVKEVHGKYYYPREKEKVQFERIRQFANKHSTIAELWIYKYDRTKKVLKEVRQLN